MTDRTASRSDARKRNAARARDAGGKHPGHSLLAKPRAKAGHPMTWFVFDEAQHFRTRTHAINETTGEFTRLDQESDMTDHRAMAEHKATETTPRYVEDAALHALLAIHDALTEIRDRLPEPTGSGTCMTCGTELYAGDPLDCRKHDPAPADDLPGEPVEPGDLRAGDRVAFTYGGERITCTLVGFHDGSTLYSDTPDLGGYRPNVAYRGEWDSGISDVRLIERSPRENEDSDEALAMDLYHASLGIPPVSQIGPTAWLSEYVHASWLETARTARKYIEAEMHQCYAKEDATAHDRAEKAEAERDEWKARHAALWGAVVTDTPILRMAAADIEAQGTGFGGLPQSLPVTLRGLADALDRDDERAAKGEQR